MLGQEVGTTNMIVQGRSGSCSVIDLVVGADPGGLQATLRDLMPDARRVRVSSAADSLVLSGTVTDSVQAQKVLDIANAFVMRQTRGPAQSPQGGAAQGQQQNGAMASNAANAGMPVRSPRIINMLVVEAPQQVMLEVKVAEVSKSLIDQMGSAANPERCVRQLELRAAGQLPLRRAGPALLQQGQQPAAAVRAGRAEG